MSSHYEYYTSAITPTLGYMNISIQLSVVLSLLVRVFLLFGHNFSAVGP